MLRPKIGVCASKVASIYGKKLKNNKKKGDILKISDFI